VSVLDDLNEDCALWCAVYASFHLKTLFFFGGKDGDWMPEDGGDNPTVDLLSL